MNNDKMSGRAYSIVTAYRASDIIYDVAAQAHPGIWIVPDNVCPAVPLALKFAGKDVRFVDIDPMTLCLDTDMVAELAKTEYIAGVVYVRTFGTDAFYDNDLAKLRKTLPDAILIDDLCIGIPQTDTPKKDGVSDVILFSTGYGKILDLGGGAYAFFKHDLGFNPAENLLVRQTFEDLLVMSSAATRTGDPIFADYDFSAAHVVQKEKLHSRTWLDLSQSIKSKLPDRLVHKAKLNAIYEKSLGRFSPLANDFQNWRYHIFVQNQSQTIDALFAAGLFASSHYAPVSKLWNIPPGVVSQRIAKKIINLFNDHHFTAKQAKQAVAIINEVGQPLR